MGLSPGGSGYFTCIQNMKLVTTKFKSGGLHEKHVVATWNLRNISINTLIKEMVMMVIIIIIIIIIIMPTQQRAVKPPEPVQTVSRRRLDAIPKL